MPTNAIAGLEEGNSLLLDFDRLKTRGGVGVMPVVVQQSDTKEVLLVGFANAVALEHTLRPPRGRDVELHPRPALGEGRHLRQFPGPCGSPRQLRTELAALPGHAAQRRSLSHQD